MTFFEEVVIKDSIEIKTTAEKVFNFLTSIKAIEKSLASVRKHMKEEGENLKIILES